MQPLPDKKYEVILADPPWGGYTPCGTARIGYDTMSTDELWDFPLDQIMAPRCVLFIWVTSPLLFAQQREVLTHWQQVHRLKYQGMPYVWVKTKKDGTPIGASGPRPRLVKPVCEFVLAFSNVRRGRPLPLETEAQRQVIFAPKDRTHSRKPAEVHRRIEALLGDRTRIELFARSAEPGWDRWGNEAPPPG